VNFRPSVRCREALELLHRLTAKVGPVHQETGLSWRRRTSPTGRQRTRQEGFCRARGHLDQSAGPVLAERLLEVGDGTSFGGQSKPISKGGIWRRRERRVGLSVLVANSSSQPASVSGRWKVKTRRARRVGVQPVRKAGIGAGGLVGKRERDRSKQELPRAAPTCTSLSVVRLLQGSCPRLKPQSWQRPCHLHSRGSQTRPWPGASMNSRIATPRPA